jgi:hypothetical protein
MSKPIVTAIASFGMSGVVFQGPSLKVLPQQFKIHDPRAHQKHICRKISRSHYCQVL